MRVRRGGIRTRSTCLGSQPPRIFLTGSLATRHQPEADVNRQGQAYVIGVFDRWDSVDEITLHFVYPRWGQVSDHTYHRSDLPGLRVALSTIVARARSKKSVEFYNDVNCLWCAKKAVCETLHRNVFSAIAPGLEGVVFNEETLRDPATAGKALNVCKLLMEIVPELKAHLMQQYQDSDILPDNYDIQSKAGKSEVADLAALTSFSRGQLRGGPECYPGIPVSVDQGHQAGCFGSGWEGAEDCPG